MSEIHKMKEGGALPPRPRYQKPETKTFDPLEIVRGSILPVGGGSLYSECSLYYYY